jgi:rubrerythrin
MMDYINREIKMTEDEGIKLLLEHMISDEKKHHEILQTIIKQAYKIQP